MPNIRVSALWQGKVASWVQSDKTSENKNIKIINKAQGVTKSLVVDMAILLEGHSADELPEVYSLKRII